jgi:acyl-coenzyme A synthetase/AMP-(fatty) acid ligase
MVNFCRIFDIRKKVIVLWHSFAKNQMTNAMLQNIDPEDTVAILFTSGSTGMAKGIAYKHCNFGA